MKRFFAFWVIFVLTFFYVNGQPSLNEKPVSFSEHLVPINMVELYLADSMEIDVERTALPMRAGQTIKLNDEIVSLGVWSQVNDRTAVWRIAFHVKKARKLNVYFKNFELDKNDRLFLYAQDEERYLGAFSVLNNGEVFASGMVDGPYLTIELVSDHIKKLPFKIEELGVVTHVYDTGKDFGGAGECEVPVNCPEGDRWQKQKTGVARILVKEGSGLYWCTGSLINNVKKDGKPYFLTANHCGRNATASNYLQWVFDFNYESENCERPVYEPVPFTLTGAYLKAHGNTPDKNNASDFKLLLLKDTVPSEVSLYFNGWDRTEEVPTHGVVIHHPQGDIKFISTYDHASSSYYYGDDDPEAPFWKVTWMPTESGHGVTEGGSSGSPLFNEKGLVVGTLTGGDASCSQQEAPDYFGKFGFHWDQNGESSDSQLAPWLDPDHTGQMQLKGFFKNQENLEAAFYSDAQKISVGSSIRFYDDSEGDILSYEWFFDGGVPEMFEGKDPPPILYGQTGKFSVKLIVRSRHDSDSLIQENYVEVTGNLFPNPFVKGRDEKVTLLVGDTPQENIEVKIYDLMGKNLTVLPAVRVGDAVLFDPRKLSDGVYLVRISINQIETPFKLMITGY